MDYDARYKVATYPGIAFYVTAHDAESDEVIAIMVGDDREYIFDASELTELDPDAYCGVCGQIGCTHDGRA